MAEKLSVSQASFDTFLSVFLIFVCLFLFFVCFLFYSISSVFVSMSSRMGLNVFSLVVFLKVIHSDQISQGSQVPGMAPCEGFSTCRVC